VDLIAGRRARLFNGKAWIDRATAALAAFVGIAPAGYTGDVTWYPPAGAPLHGIEAIRPRCEQLFANFAVALRSDALEATGNGATGYVIGTTQGTLTPLAGGHAVEAPAG